MIRLFSLLIPPSLLMVMMMLMMITRGISSDPFFEASSLYVPSLKETILWNRREIQSDVSDDDDEHHRLFLSRDSISSPFSSSLSLEMTDTLVVSKRKDDRGLNCLLSVSFLLILSISSSYCQRNSLTSWMTWLSLYFGRRRNMTGDIYRLQNDTHLLDRKRGSEAQEKEWIWQREVNGREKRECSWRGRQLSLCVTWH